MLLHAICDALLGAAALLLGALVIVFLPSGPTGETAVETAASCAEANQSALKSPGTLTVGTGNPAFPPFVRLVALHIQGEREEEVRQGAQRLAGFCRDEKKRLQAGVEILGPAPSPIERLNRNYRWQILLKASEIEELHRLCRCLLELCWSRPRQPAYG